MPSLIGSAEGDTTSKYVCKDGTVVSGYNIDIAIINGMSARKPNGTCDSSDGYWHIIKGFTDLAVSK